MPTIPEGKTVGELLALGFSVSEILAGSSYTLISFSATVLKAAGYTALQLNTAGFSPSILVALYSLAELSTSDINIADIISNKYITAQLGGDIDGAIDDSNSGYSVSVNTDGTRVAIGATWKNTTGNYSGSTRMYEYNAVTYAWQQLGNVINGEAQYDYSGHSVSMNAAGTRVAIGAPYNDGAGPESGSTRVYEYNGADWLQLGNAMGGQALNDNSGYSISMNAAGTRVAIGAPGTDANGYDSGRTCVFEYDGANWLQLGGAINGEAQYDNSGSSVSINAAGTRVAIGARYNSGSGFVSGIFELKSGRMR